MRSHNISFIYLVILSCLGSFLESEVVFCEDLSLDGSSIDERFFFLPVLKSVSYHPLPYSLKDGADIILTRLSLLQFGHKVFGLSLNF
jgi:hypothetical protein